MTRVKVCCIASVEEARTAIQHGASALGLVSAMPSGPGPIPEELIASIAATVPPPVATFLLTSLVDSAEIVSQHERCRTSTIQLVDRLDDSAHRKLRLALPGIKLVQVVHVVGESSVEEAFRAAAEVDAIMLDSGNHELPVKELGGTGRTHDWTVAARIVSEIRVPVFLAGGLHAGNVGEAIETVRPFAVDLCSRIRTGGRLDEDKLDRFMSEVQRAG